MTETTEFCYLIRPVRGSQFIETMTEEEQAIMGEHFLYLQDLQQKGTLILAGPCLDAAFGVAIFRADSLEAAQSIMTNDPAIKKGVMTSELHPFRVSLLETVPQTS